MEPIDSKVLNAIRRGQFKQLSLYLRHGYELNVMTSDGRNGLFLALDIADARRRRRMIRFCLDHGMDALQGEHTYGYTPLHEAIARQQYDSVQLLLANAGGEVDWRAFDKRGRTILHQAVEGNNLPIIEALIRVMLHFGVSVDIPDQSGLTPFLLATKLHLPDVARILVEKGHASRQQCDLASHRSVDEWQRIGLDEHRSLVRQQLRQEIESAMQEGKVNRVKKLKSVYYSPLLTPPSRNEASRRDSIQTVTTMSSANLKTSVSINELIDQLSDGEIPETFATSTPDEQTFHLNALPPTSLPPVSSNPRPRQAAISLNALVDLFQVVQ